MTRLTRTITILLLTLSLFCLCSCGDKDDEEANIPTTEELIASQYDQLTSAFEGKTESSDIVSYAASWAEKKGISSYVTEDGIFVMKKDASKGYEKENSKVLMCSVDGKDNETTMQYLSTLLYSFDNLGKHSTTYGVVMPEGSADSLPDEVASCDEFINLEYSEKPFLINSCATSAEYELRSSESKVESDYDIAYRISIRHLDGGDITDVDGAHPNAVLNISSFLAGCKSSGLLYDLAYLKGGSGYDKYSKSAKAVVVISKNDQEKFEKKLDKAIEKFNSKWKDKQKDAEYTYKKIKKPSKVLEAEDRDNLISLLYTMITGTYSENEDSGEIIAYSNIGKVSVKDGTMKVKIKAFSKDEGTLDEMCESIRTLSKISNFKAHKKDTSMLWEEPADSDLITGLDAAAKECKASLPDKKSTFRTHECSIIQEKNKKAHLISLGTGFSNWTDVANTVITYAGTK